MIYTENLINANNIIKSGSYSSYGPLNVIDNNSTTVWMGQRSVGTWIGFDNGFPINVCKVEITSSSHELYIWGGDIKNFNIEGSNDLKKWDIVYGGITTNNYPNGNVKNPFIFNENNIKYRYWRIFIITTYSASNYGNIAELSMYSSIEQKYLIEQNNKFYTIKSEYFNNEYLPLEVTSLTQEDFNNYGFNDINDLTREVTINEDVFKPIDKFNNFKIYMYKK